ncbi:MAG: PmbA protein [Kosmotogales bacterium]|nr:PmbA protein [Kosmotogales bacterium]
MIKEKFQTRTIQTAINVVQTEVESIRKKDILKTGMRIYDSEKIGVAGALGKFDEEELTDKAKKALGLDIEYKARPTENIQEEKVISSEIFDEKEFLDKINDLLYSLKKEQPDFLFSHKAIMTRNDVTIKNDVGLDLHSDVSSLDVSFLIKHKDSSNIMDSFVGYQGLDYDKKEFVSMTNKICEAYKNDIKDFKNGKYPIIFFTDDATYLLKFFNDLNGLIFGSGGSIFSNKLNEKLFNEEFSLNLTRNIEDGHYGSFFDFEGTVLSDYRYPLIEKGVLKAPYSDKNTAKKFNLPVAGSASGDYDSVPNIGTPHLFPGKSNKSLLELTAGRAAIFALLVSGGDFTSEGKFSTPIQVGYLFDGKNFVGKLPQLKVSSSIYEMFGKDFIGVSSDSMTTLNNHSNTIVFDMDVELL